MVGYTLWGLRTIIGMETILRTPYLTDVADEEWAFIMLMWKQVLPTLSVLWSP